MAATESAPATIEVNDAIFCTHYLEVVRSDSHNRKISPEYSMIAYSVPIVVLMEEKRMILSLGWVSSIIVYMNTSMAARVLMKHFTLYSNSIRISLV